MVNYDFDVLIPLAGDCKFIRETFESVKQSTAQPNKILLIDDGIEPAVVEIIKDYSKILNINLLKSLGTGIVDALNTGINFSESRYIARLDGDDEVKYKRFEHQINFLNSNSDAVAVGSRIEFIDENSNVTGTSTHPFGLLNNLPRFRQECLLAHPSTLIKREALLKLDGYRTLFKFGKYDLCEDFDLWLRLSDLGEIWNLEESLTRYRVHPNQVTFQLANAFEFSTYLISRMQINNNPIINEIDLKSETNYVDILENNLLNLDKLSLLVAKLIRQKHILIKYGHSLVHFPIIIGFKFMIKILRIIGD